MWSKQDKNIVAKCWRATPTHIKNAGIRNSWCLSYAHLQFNNEKKIEQSWYVWKSDKYVQKADHLKNNQKQFRIKKLSFNKICLLIL